MRSRIACAADGCHRAAVERGRCELHQPRRRQVSAALVLQVVRRDRGICWLCKRRGADTADHVKRIRDGGTDELSNLRAAHERCNKSRG